MSTSARAVITHSAWRSVPEVEALQAAFTEAGIQTDLEYVLRESAPPEWFAEITIQAAGGAGAAAVIEIMKLMIKTMKGIRSRHDLDHGRLYLRDSDRRLLIIIGTNVPPEAYDLVPSSEVFATGQGTYRYDRHLQEWLRTD